MTDSTSTDLPPAVQAWLEAHPEADAEALEEVWHLSREATPVMEPDPDRVDAVRDALWDELGTDRSPAATDGASERRPGATERAGDRSPTAGTRRWAGAVGTALLVLLLAAALYAVAVPVRITAPAGQVRTATLPDGTEVDLNSGTTLRYPRWWSVDLLRTWLGRRVHLTGEAFFAVRSTGSPFRVETANAEVRVRGTRFNVRARRVEGRPNTRVVVADGRVALSAAGRATRLGAAQTATVRGTAPPSAAEDVRLDRALAWRRGGVSFRDASIRAVSAEVARRFDVSVEVDAGVEGRPVTLYVDRARGATALLRDVCSVAGCRVDSTARGLVVRPR